ncbi:hypothetical protein L1987_79088 [Smallanthus sonchifolius]|uniref:Uncharacterized protein n=1 Tax=Smallanthus sonchifolius TaxID=185202 RepID=A0ACB8ZEG5_9ASTR|nr:hypothetical protein L1987_79088 [Smallanthus sonchifolius]
MTNHAFCSHIICSVPPQPSISSMAPKRRKKTGLTRMDAALDQMSSLGFSKQIVRKTVGKLLKVYGDDGWKFIEEDGYKVLLDVILEEQETAETPNLLKDESSAKVALENVSFSGNDKASLTYNAESSEVPLRSIEGPGNQECLKDADVVKHDLHSSPFGTGDDHSANKVNLQNSENTPLSGCSCNTVHAPLSFYHFQECEVHSGARTRYPAIILEEGWLVYLINYYGV